MKKIEKKLLLRTETVRTLDVRSLRDVVGGAKRDITQSCPSVDICPSLSECGPSQKTV